MPVTVDECPRAAGSPTTRGSATGQAHHDRPVLRPHVTGPTALTRLAPLLGAGEENA